MLANLADVLGGILAHTFWARHDRPVESDDPTWRSPFSRGLRALSQGEFDDAERWFARAHTLAPDQPEVAFALGREHLRRGRYHDARPLLERAWESDHGFASAAASLARCVGVGLRDREGGLAVLDAATVVGIDRASLDVVRGEIHLAFEEPVAARAAFVLAIAMVSNTPDSAVVAPGARTAGGVRRSAQAGLARAANLEGVLLGRQARLDEALFAFKRAADLDPQWAAPIVNLGAAFARLGRPARARSSFERALVLDPESTIALFNLAGLSNERGERAQAEGHLRRVLDLEPAYPGAREMLAEILLERGDARGVIALHQGVAEEGRLGSSGLYQLGVAHDMEGDALAAEAWLRRAVAGDEADVIARCHLAAVLERAGRFDEAVRHAREARDRDAQLAGEVLADLGSTA